MTVQLELDQKIDLTRIYTLTEFLELPFEDGYDYELLLGGRILASSRDPGPGKPHSDAAGNIFTALKAFVLQNPAAGWVWFEASVRLDQPGIYVRPDITYLAATDIAPQEAYAGPITGLPSLVVEVNSPSDTVKDISDKLATYLAAGVKLIWSVYPLDQYVEVFKPGARKPEVYGLGDVLLAEDLLPDFKLSCEAIFARYQSSEQ